MNTIIKRELIEPNEKSYQDVLIYTNKVHTNAIAGGHGDA